MGKLKEQLAGIAALIAAIVAIGGGFVKYGEIVTKLEALEGAGGADHSAEIAVLEEKVKCTRNCRYITHSRKLVNTNTKNTVTQKF